MAPLAIFGINNDGLNLAANLLVLFLVAIWLALVVWTYADARRRIVDEVLVYTAAAASLFPFVGTLIYLIVRPPEYLEDVRERELEIAAAEARLSQVEVLACPYCDFEVEKSFLRCPSCLRRLKEPCANCSRPLDPRWKICPYCEADVAQPPRQERARARPQARERQPGEPARGRPSAREKRPARAAPAAAKSPGRAQRATAAREPSRGSERPPEQPTKARPAPRTGGGARQRPPARPPTSS